jgi:tetratricopeptide (TPR) repeat protein
MGEAIKDLSSIEIKTARYEKNQNLNDAVVLGRYSSAIREYKKAVDYYTYANKMSVGSDKDYAFEIFRSTIDGVSDSGFTMENVLAAADAALASENARLGQKIYTIKRTISGTKKSNMPEAVEKYINAGLKLVEGSDSDEAKMAYAELMVEHSLYITKDEAKAVEYKKMTMNEGWTEDAGGLNSFAWWCFENKINLEEAEKFARKGVELAEPGKNKAMILDTLAEICNLLDNCHESVELIKLAIKENPESKFYPEQLARFEKILAAQDK